jgi:hypothetical protein
VYTCGSVRPAERPVFQIREEQMQAFQSRAIAGLGLEMLEQRRGFAPELHEIVGDQGFEPFIDLGIEKTPSAARTYGAQALVAFQGRG